MPIRLHTPVYRLVSFRIKNEALSKDAERISDFVKWTGPGIARERPTGASSCHASLSARSNVSLQKVLAAHMAWMTQLQHLSSAPK